MKADQLHPELRLSAARFPSPPLHNIAFVYLSKLLLKILPLPEAGPDVYIENRKLNCASVRIYRPAGELSGAGLLWVHGGGLVIGRVEDDRICAAFARDLKVVVVSVKYRLAPTHKYPCAINDCLEAWNWLQKESPKLGINPTRIAISGQSAGGGLAASLAQRLYDIGNIQPAAQILFCPMLDDRTALRHNLDEIHHLMWSNRSNRNAWSWYLGHPAGSPDIPPYAAAARREYLAGLPPAWITVGDIELFYDEDHDYAERLKAAGIRCQLYITSKTPHCFEVIAPDSKLARYMFLSAYQFLSESLDLPFDPNNYSYGQPTLKAERAS